MKKIFTFFAAMLLALTASATGTDFATPGYSCAASDAVLSGDGTSTAATTEPVSNKLCLVTADPNYLAWKDVSNATDYAVAKWTITAAKGCYVSVSLGLGARIIDSNKHIFEVKIKDDKGNTKGTLAEPAENADADQVKTLEGTILIPAEGNYTVELRNTRNWGKGAVVNVILTYAADAPTEIIRVSSVELNKTELALQVEEVEQLTATVLPDNATNPTVTWESSDESVATVDGGFVTAVAAGTADIIATADGKSDTCSVTVSAVSVPSTDFSSDYVLSAKKAQLEGKIWKMYKDATYKLYGDGGSNKHYGNAYWTIHVSQPCVVTGTLNGVEGGHMFALDLYQGNDSIGTIAHPKAKYWTAGNIAMDSVGYSTLTFPAAGDYTLKLRNTLEWSSGKVESITLTKEYDLIDIYLKAGVWHDAGAKFGVYDRGSSSWWPEFMEYVEDDYYVFRNFPANKVYLNFVRLKNTTVAPGNDDDIWNQVVNLTRENDNNCMYITDWSAGQWRKYFPGLEAGYYLVGTHNSWEPKAADILAENVAGVEYMITKNAEEDDQFKAIRIDTEGLNAGWYPDGSDNEYTIPAELAGNVTIYFRPDGNNEWPDTNGGGKKFYVVRNGDPTDIDNTVVGEKAMKLIENGQIVIVKNGVRYNVLGTVIK